MSQILVLDSEQGIQVALEVEERPGLQRAGGGRAPRTFEEALDRIRPVANAVIQKIRSIELAPDEVEVKFGLKLSTEADIIISSASTEANFEFTLTWKRDEKK